MVYFDKIAHTIKVNEAAPSLKVDVQGSFNSHYSNSKPIRVAVAAGSRWTRFLTADAFAASRLETGVAL